MVIYDTMFTMFLKSLVQIYGTIIETIVDVDFDIFAIGGDQTHEGFQRAVKWCNENNKKVVRLQRTPGICSSQIKKQLQSLE